MDKSKIKVLGIAPYSSMKQKMEELAEKFSQLDIDVYVGDLNEGVNIVLQNASNNYDVIISRGGTAQMIGEITSIPVIEITLSVYDILRAIKLAENYSNKYAIVGFPSITKSAHILCDLLQYKIEIVTINNSSDVEKTLCSLKENGCKMVLCDMVTNTAAKRLGLNSILFLSGNESIESAFIQAIKLCTNYAGIKEENSLLENIIQGYSSHIVVFDDAKKLYFTTLDKDIDEIVKTLRNEISKVLHQNPIKTFHSFHNKLYSVQSRIALKGSSSYVVFYISDIGVPMISSKYGIRFSDKKELEQELYNNFYSLSVPEIKKQIDQISMVSFPVMLLGEAGTEKDQVAQTLYIQSEFQCNPFVAIDCLMINDKNWNFITNHYNSPLMDNNNTIYFKNIDSLPPSKEKQLSSLITDMKLCRRNRVIFSCTSTHNNCIPKAASDFINRFSCLTITLPALRDLIDELPTFSSLYLGSLNVDLPHQIIGFEPDALKLLQSYSWPENFIQFKRVINNLAVITSTSYISTKDVDDYLKKIPLVSDNPDSKDSTETWLDLNRPLEEITFDVIQRVFRDNNGNQTATARQLGISRSTLWRYLKKSG